MAFTSVMGPFQVQLGSVSRPAPQPTGGQKPPVVDARADTSGSTEEAALPTASFQRTMTRTQQSFLAVRRPTINPTGEAVAEANRQTQVDQEVAAATRLANDSRRGGAFKPSQPPLKRPTRGEDVPNGGGGGGESPFGTEMVDPSGLTTLPLGPAPTKSKAGLIVAGVAFVLGYFVFTSRS